MKQATHILNWRTATHSQQTTLCGKMTGRALGVPLGVTVASNPHDATCWTCRKVRDGR